MLFIWVSLEELKPNDAIKLHGSHFQPVINTVYDRNWVTVTVKVTNQTFKIWKLLRFHQSRVSVLDTHHSIRSRMLLEQTTLSKPKDVKLFIDWSMSFFNTSNSNSSNVFGSSSSSTTTSQDAKDIEVSPSALTDRIQSLILIGEQLNFWMLTLSFHVYAICCLNV